MVCEPLTVQTRSTFDYIHVCCGLSMIFLHMVTFQSEVRKDIKHVLLVKKICHRLGYLLWDIDVIFLLIIVGIEVDNVTKKPECRPPPVVMSGDEILHQITP